jgi:hypothetical protein
VQTKSCPFDLQRLLDISRGLLEPIVKNMGLSYILTTIDHKVLKRVLVESQKAATFANT